MEPDGGRFFVGILSWPSELSKWSRASIWSDRFFDRIFARRSYSVVTGRTLWPRREAGLFVNIGLIMSAIPYCLSIVAPTGHRELYEKLRLKFKIEPVLVSVLVLISVGWRNAIVSSDLPKFDYQEFERMVESLSDKKV